MSTGIQHILLGTVAGIISGFLGLGGGTIIIPALVLLFGYTQHQAQGTSLLLVALPVGILAAIKYYIQGNLLIKPGLLVAVGFMFGAYLGAEFAHKIPDVLLRKIFAIFMLLVSIKMFFSK